jgi:hypothetical protein
MPIRRWVIPYIALALTVSSAVVWAQKPDKKQEEANRKESPNVIKLVDDVAAGQPAPNDLALTWAHEDFLKAVGNKGYVPFTVTLDPTKVTGGTVVLYWRVVGADQSAAAPTPAKNDKNAKKDDKKNEKSSKFPYEDMTFVQVTPAQNPAVISRSFTVPAGTYDVYVVAKEPTPDKAPKGAPPPKASVLKHAVTVPDFWNGELSTSSLMIAQRIDPLPAPLTPEQQTDRPYALGTMEIVPALDTKFSKRAELQPFLMIYNPKLDPKTNKPDVVVEYNFYVKSGGTEKFFNKTKPQDLNAETLPPQFDMAAGHQLSSGQAIPLASFPEGDYRLEIKITDKVANKSLTRDVNFTVTAS